MTEQLKPFESIGYEPVPVIVNRLLARYLRAQRKNMKRFFEERGLLVLADRMDQIRRSRQGMMAKNRMFQEVLNEYAALANPVAVPSVPGAVLGSPHQHQSAVPVRSSPLVIAGETDDQ